MRAYVEVDALWYSVPHTTVACVYVCMYMYVCSRTDTCKYACVYMFVCLYVSMCCRRRYMHYSILFPILQVCVGTAGGRVEWRREGEWNGEGREKRTHTCNQGWGGCHGISISMACTVETKTTTPRETGCHGDPIGRTGHGRGELRI